MICPQCDRRPCAPGATKCAGYRSARKTGQNRPAYRSGWQLVPLRRLQAARRKAQEAA